MYILPPSQGADWHIRPFVSVRLNLYLIIKELRFSMVLYVWSIVRGFCTSRRGHRSLACRGRRRWAMSWPIQTKFPDEIESFSSCLLRVHIYVSYDKPNRCKVHDRNREPRYIKQNHGDHHDSLAESQRESSDGVPGGAYLLLLPAGIQGRRPVDRFSLWCWWWCRVRAGCAGMAHEI
jgi:hypothetical protein